MSDITFLLPRSARGTSVSVSGTTAQSVALNEDNAVLYSTVDCFAIIGANPTATTAGGFIPANTLVRVGGWKAGEKIAFITEGGTGSVRIMPGA